MVVLDDRVFLGSVADLVLEARDESGNLVDLATAPTVEVRNPRSVIVVSSTAATRESLGTYVYRYQSALTDLLGLYKAVFSATISGATERYIITFRLVDM